MHNERLATHELTDSAPWPVPWSTPSVEPELVVCPIPMAVPGVNSGLVEELYRLAYERALAAQRPSRYEMACQVSLN